MGPSSTRASPSEESLAERPGKGSSSEGRKGATNEMKALAKTCTRFLAGDGPRSSQALLSQIDTGVEVDVYGEGGIVQELEEEVARMLGKESAVFMLSGIMSQQIVLRVLTDVKGSKRVLMHRKCHLRTHEDNAFELLHGLKEVLVKTTGPQGPITLAALQELDREEEATPLGAVLLELPQRDIGGYLPTWEELESQVGWARGRGAAVHLDGARLWEAAPYYSHNFGKSLADICALFDTAYVSFYKGLGGISGACVVGDKDICAEVCLWRKRHGGRPYMLWPYAASCLTVLRTRPQDMLSYYLRAQVLSRELRGIPGVEVWPAEANSPLMHVRFAASVTEMEERVRLIAVDQQILTFPRVFSSDEEGWTRYEYQVGRASMTFTLDEMVSLFRQLAGYTRQAK